MAERSCALSVPRRFALSILPRKHAGPVCRMTASNNGVNPMDCQKPSELVFKHQFDQTVDTALR